MGFLYNPVTGEKIFIDDEEIIINIETARTYKFIEIESSYADEVSKGFSSYITGKEVRYGYNEQDKMNFLKISNQFALSPKKINTSIISLNDGIVTLTKIEFLQLMEEAEEHEMALYRRKEELEELIDTATTVEELGEISW